MARTFSPFPKLPRELRDMIWEEAAAQPNESLSDPTLYFYRGPGNWKPYLLPESHPGYQPGEDYMGLDFCTDSLDGDNQFQLPLLFVNREARAVALRWLRKQCNKGIKAQRQADGTIVFTRAFNPNLDAIYVPASKWEQFYLEHPDRIFQPDLEAKWAAIDYPFINLAIPEAIFFDSKQLLDWVYGMELWGTCPRTLLVVVGVQPDDVRGLGRWAVEGDGGWWLSWNGETKEFEYHGESEVVGDGTLRRRIKEAAERGMREELVNCVLRRMDIRPVCAVRR